MPQMFPLNWIFLYIYFLLLFFLLIINNYFLSNFILKSNKKMSFKAKKMIWKW